MKSKRNRKGILVFTALEIATLFFINTSLAADIATVNVETANLRETADANSKILEQLSQNQEVEVLEKDGNWYKVKVNGIAGYLRNDLVTLEKNEENTTTDVDTNNELSTDTIVETTTNQEENKADTQNNENTEKEAETTKKIVAEDTKLKIVPTINATDIIELKKDEEVTIIETINDWVCVQTKTTKGWIRKDKLKSVEEKQETIAEEQKVEETKPVVESKLKTLYINTETVNLRKEANTDSEVLSKLSLNTAVDVYAEENGWSKVKVSGKEGYISSSLLSDKKKETSRSLETPRKAQETVQENAKTEKSVSEVSASGKGTNVVETAKSYIGSSYVYGASGPNSFDCSGFTSYVFKQYGVSLSRTAAGQYSNGVSVSKEQLQPGDLVMFGKSGINHVGIYIGGGQMVHAANKSRGVTTDTIESGYYNNNYVGARRVM